MIWLLIRLVGASRSSSKRARVPGVHLACGWRVDVPVDVRVAVRVRERRRWGCQLPHAKRVFVCAPWMGSLDT